MTAVRIGLSQVTHTLIPIICTGSQVLPSIQLVTLGSFSEPVLVLLSISLTVDKGVQAHLGEYSYIYVSVKLQFQAAFARLPQPRGGPSFRGSGRSPSS